MKKIDKKVKRDIANNKGLTELHEFELDNVVGGIKMPSPVIKPARFSGNGGSIIVYASGS